MWWQWSILVLTSLFVIVRVLFHIVDDLEEEGSDTSTVE